MASAKANSVVSGLTWVQVIIFLIGLAHFLAGLTQLVAPTWFFGNIGPFPPFNRHYLGDLGAFILPMGFGLILAARNPSQHWLLIGVVAMANLVHTFNHMYDAIVAQASLAFWLTDIGPSLVATVLLILITWSPQVRQ